jgi:hypothetical protein
MPDTDFDFLRPLDPTLHDAPPAPGSARYEAIRLKAQPPRTRRWMTWAAIGTGVAASVLATVVVVLGGSSTSANAAVLTAAERTEKVVTLRGTTQSQTKTGGTSRSTIEANGSDLKIVEQDDIGTVTTTIVGATTYESNSDGTRSKVAIPPAPRLAPFADAAGTVVRAALDGANVTDKGSEQVRGVDTTHYHVTLTAASRRALDALPPAQTAWFEVEHADQITSIDIWTAGDLIRRIAVDQPERRTMTEFYDFGQPVTITVPPGF